MADLRIADKYEYLQGLVAGNRLATFYENKSIEALTDDEIFFLMNSATPYNLSRRGQGQLIDKVDSPYFKCLLYKEF